MNLEDLLEHVAADDTAGDADAVFANATTRSRVIQRRRRTMMAATGTLAVGVIVALGAIALNNQPSSQKVSVATPPSTTPYSGPPRYEIIAGATAGQDGRATLCLGAVALGSGSCSRTILIEGATFPPGPVMPHRFVGTLDGSTLTLTQPATPDRPGGVAHELDFPTPCEPPADGWRVRNPGRMSNNDWNALREAAEAEPDFAAFWIGSARVADGESVPATQNRVLNIAFTGDLERHRTELEAIWGGPLCVSQLPHTQKEVRDAAAAANAFAESKGIYVLGYGVEGVDTATLEVVSAPPGFEAALAKNVPGVSVRLDAQLKLVD